MVVQHIYHGAVNNGKAGIRGGGGGVNLEQIFGLKKINASTHYIRIKIITRKVKSAINNPRQQIPEGVSFTRCSRSDMELALDSLRRCFLT